MKAVLGPLERTAWNYRPTGPQIWLLPLPLYTFPRLPVGSPRTGLYPDQSRPPGISWSVWSGWASPCPGWALPYRDSQDPHSKHQGIYG